MTGASEGETLTKEQRAARAESQRQARRTVASFATDADDCRTLLAMLGLAHSVAAVADPDEPAYRMVDNAKARKHVKYLRDHDVPMPVIADRADISIKTAYGILERPTARDYVVEQVCAVTLEDCGIATLMICDRRGVACEPRGVLTYCRPCGRGEVPVTRARERLLQLHAFAGSWTRVAALVGLDVETARAIVYPNHCRARSHIRPATETRILNVEISASAGRVRA